MNKEHKEELEQILLRISEVRLKIKNMNEKYMNTIDSEDKKKGLVQIRSFLEESRLISNPDILEQFENIDKSKEEWSKVFNIVNEQLEVFEKEVNDEIRGEENISKVNENNKEGEEQNVEVTDKGKVIIRYKNILSNINNMLEHLDKGMKSIENDINQLTKILETDYGMKVEKYTKEVEQNTEKVEEKVAKLAEKKVEVKKETQPIKEIEEDEEVEITYDPRNLL